VVTRESTSMLDTLVELLGHGAVSFGEIRPDTDTVVVTVGLPSGEGADRASLDLSAPEKSMLFDALAQAKSEGKRTVVVLNVCGPIDMREFIDDVDALVCVFITGMQGGRAAADLLCGIFSPSGKLPVTFAKRYEDYASSTNFPGLGNEVLYAEDVYVGYRHFDRWDVEPLFPFGHGLSYTTFSLANPQLSSPEINVDHQEELTLTAELTNGGAVAGQEVVQLYVSQPRSTRPKPPKQLKAFKKIEVQPGETVSVRFTVGRRFFEEYNELLQKWVVEPETYVLMLGTSSRELPCSVEVVVQGTNPYETTPVSNPLDLFTQGG
jgi:beta-glucosidase